MSLPHVPIPLHVVQREGDAPALVLLHFYGGSHRSWQAMLDVLGEEFAAYALDLRGFGDSPSAPPGYSIEAAAHDVTATVDALNLDSYVVCGHSMGGKIALAFAAEQPKGLRGMVLLAPSPPTPEPMSEEGRTQLRASWGSRVLTEKILRGASYTPLPDAIFEDAVQDSLHADPDAWNEWLDIGTRENISEAIANISVPTLVVAGGHDGNMTPDLLQHELVAHLPHAQLETIANAGHLLPLEAPAECAKLLREFVRGLAQSGSS